MTRWSRIVALTAALLVVVALPASAQDAIDVEDEQAHADHRVVQRSGDRRVLGIDRAWDGQIAPP